MALKITSGDFKGLMVRSPPTDATRPTAIKVRQAVVNTLAPFCEGAVLLELFAGSGALGIEALSRGAAGAVFVESGNAAIKALAENLENVSARARQNGRLLEPFQLIRRDAAKAWGDIARFGPYDIVWVDPPYAEVPKWAPVLAKELKPLCKAEAIVAVESDAKGAAAVAAAFSEAKGWQPWKDKRYGDTKVLMYLNIA